MEFRLTGLGFNPFFIVDENGEIAGFEVDNVKALVEKVGGTLIVEEAIDWLIPDKDGNYIGCIPEVVLYRRATFAVSQIMPVEELIPFAEFIIVDFQPYIYRATKPGVNH